MEFWSLFSKRREAKKNLKIIKISANKNLFFERKLCWKIFLEIFFDTFHNILGMSHMEMMRTFDRWHFKLKKRQINTSLNHWSKNMSMIYTRIVLFKWFNRWFWYWPLRFNCSTTSKIWWLTDLIRFVLPNEQNIGLNRSNRFISKCCIQWNQMKLKIPSIRRTSCLQIDQKQTFLNASSRVKCKRLSKKESKRDEHRRKNLQKTNFHHDESIVLEVILLLHRQSQFENSAL